jgi:GH15 family glucan-1,4-alpha-glucosidase
MSQPIEDYALIGNTHTAALVGRNGAIDWLCLPTFASPSCFCALLGTRDHGYWQIVPAYATVNTRRRYREGTLILETEFATETGKVSLIDFMPVATDEELVKIIRVVRGHSGGVPMEMELSLRFDYSRTIPWVRHAPYGLTAVAGPHAVKFATPVHLESEDFVTHAHFTVRAGETIPFVLTWHKSHHPPPPTVDEARQLFERLLSVRNDVGLLAEEYDPHSGRQIGNFPQALSHVALINSAQNLSRMFDGPAHERAHEGQQPDDKPLKSTA